MTVPSGNKLTAVRGELWRVRFDPSQGAEIAKTRPAVVINVPTIGRLPLRIVVPITGWYERFATIPWLIFLACTPLNGLDKDSTADCFQVKSVSLNRLESKIGTLLPGEIEQISAAISLCVGA